MTTRYLFALDFLSPQLPPTRDSAQDIGLLRAANLALRRHREGIDDAFLFVVYGTCDQEAVKRMLGAYGFPSLTVRFAGEDEPLRSDDKGRVTLDDDFDEATGNEVRNWVEREHPGSLPLLALLSPDEKALEDYRASEWRWIGCEAGVSDFLWPFEVDAFKTLLPGTHAARANTWLELLARGDDVDEDLIRDRVYEGFRVTATAAALCEWLHGFEAASGNSYNHYQPDEAVYGLGLNLVLLGREAADLLDGEDDELLEEADIEHDVVRVTGRALTARYRTRAQSALGILGGDSALFFTLYSSIRPRYEHTIARAAGGLLGLEDVEMGEIDAAWEFVSNGWHDSADADW